MNSKLTIVGTDGIRSVVRGALWGKDDPKFTGHMCWRALVPVDEHPLPFVQPAVTFWFGPKAHVVTYYVKGGKAVNIDPNAVGISAEWIYEYDATTCRQSFGTSTGVGTTVKAIEKQCSGWNELPSLILTYNQKMT